MVVLFLSGPGIKSESCAVLRTGKELLGTKVECRTIERTVRKGKPLFSCQIYFDIRSILYLLRATGRLHPSVHLFATLGSEYHG